ncbi:MAG: flagellar filament capping protein FliD, partial [Syntrophales bacterium]|nr:flagellar filament capping protein FliD [Syntrophales bacterium]
MLTSDRAGAEGIDLRNGGSKDIWGALGFTDATRVTKHHIAGGDLSDRFSSTTISLQALLGLSNAQSAAAGDIVINGHSIGAIDFATDSLSSIQVKLAAAGVTASLTSETEGSQTYYRLLIGGSNNTYSDKNNILETLGLIRGGLSDVKGVTGDVANTARGQAITSATRIKDIDGFTGYASTDYIHLGGTDTNGGTVNDDTFVLSETTTVGELLTKIKALFGDVTATVTGDGKIRIVDNTSGESRLNVKINVKNQGGETDDTLRFDSDGDLGTASTVRKREVIAGADASVTIDGVEVTSANNTIHGIISGVTLDLLKADSGTTVNLRIERDNDAIVAKVQAFVTAYNNVFSFIKAQTSFDETKQKAGGVLFGDGTLASVRSELTAILVNRVWGVANDFSTLGLVGGNVDRYGQLSLDEDTFKGYL